MAVVVTVTVTAARRGSMRLPRRRVKPWSTARPIPNPQHKILKTATATKMSLLNLIVKECVCMLNFFFYLHFSFHFELDYLKVDLF